VRTRDKVNVAAAAASSSGRCSSIAGSARGARTTKMRGGLAKKGAPCDATRRALYVETECVCVCLCVCEREREREVRAPSRVAELPTDQMARRQRCILMSRSREPPSKTRGDVAGPIGFFECPPGPMGPRLDVASPTFRECEPRIRVPKLRSR
jgi:hypothetical protein